MLINLQPYRSSLRERIQYLLYGVKGKERKPSDVFVFGNVGAFLASGEVISRKVKAFSYLVSFKEDYETFIGKVGDLHSFVDELLSWLIPYEKEDYEVLVVGHKDTDHFHLHITVLNRNLRTGKALYIPRTRSEVQFYQALCRYFDAVYGLERGNPSLVKHFVGDQLGKKELGKIKELIARTLAAFVREGYVDSREELLEYLKDMGFEVVDVWSSGVRVRREGVELALTGGLFDEREFENVRGELQKGERVRAVKDFASKSFRDLREELERLSERRRREVQKRVERDLERAERLRRKRRSAEVARGEDRGEKKEPVLAEDRGLLPSSLSRFPDWSSGGWGWSVEQRESKGSLPSPLQVGVREGVRGGKGHSMVRWKEVVVQKLLEVSGRGWEVESGGRRGVLRSPPTNTAVTVERYIMERRMPFSRDEIEKAKMIDPLTLFGYYGLEYEIVGGQYRIRAPWRDEREPSVYVKVNPETGHLIWKDFGGEQDGGSAIDFVMKASGVSFVEAVSLLLEVQGEPVLPEHPDEKLPSSFSRKSLPSNYKHRILKVKDRVDHTALKELLYRKGLDYKELPPAVKELHWEISRDDGYKARFFGIAVQTIKGSWIVRTAMDSRPKTVVKEDKDGHSFAFCPASSGKARKLAVVEGITDYIALWQYLRKRGIEEDYDFVVLGGTGMIGTFVESEIWQGYEEVVLGLDLDESGMKARDWVIERLKGLGYQGVVFSLSRSLSMYGKDINEIASRGDIEFEMVYNPFEINGYWEEKQNRERGGLSPGL